MVKEFISVRNHKLFSKVGEMHYILTSNVWDVLLLQSLSSIWFCILNFFPFNRCIAVIQSLSHVRLLWPHGQQHSSLPCPSLSPRVCSLTSIELVMPSNHLILCQLTDLIFLSSKMTVDNDYSHEIKRRLVLRRKAMTNLDSILKSRDITLPTKVHIIKPMVFPVVMHGCERWTIKNKLMFLNCGVREDSWESLGLQGDQTNQS